MSIPFFTPGDSAKTGLVAKSALNAVGPEIPIGNGEQVGGSLQWGDGVTAGKVVFEIGPAGSTGDWEMKFSSDFVADDVTTNFGSPPCTQSFTYPGTYSGAGRWRIAAEIVGGTVTTDLQMLVS